MRQIHKLSKIKILPNNNMQETTAVRNKIINPFVVNFQLCQDAVCTKEPDGCIVLFSVSFSVVELFSIKVA